MGRDNSGFTTVQENHLLRVFIENKYSVTKRVTLFNSIEDLTDANNELDIRVNGGSHTAFKKWLLMNMPNISGFTVKVESMAQLRNNIVCTSGSPKGYQCIDDIVLINKQSLISNLVVDVDYQTLLDGRIKFEMNVEPLQSLEIIFKTDMPYMDPKIILLNKKKKMLAADSATQRQLVEKMLMDNPEEFLEMLEL